MYKHMNDRYLLVMTRAIPCVVGLCSLSGCGSADVATETNVVRQSAPLATQSPHTQSQSAAPVAQSQDQRRNWKNAIKRTPPPKKGCFKTSYPSTVWKEVPCGIAPPHHQALRGAADVGNGNDYMAMVSGTTISAATGSFPSVTGISLPLDEVDSKTNNLSGFSLQINSNHFDTPLCNGHSDCQGWQQFVYHNTCALCSAYVLIEYWLIGYGRPCPPDPDSSHSWKEQENDCFLDSLTGDLDASSGINQLSDLELEGWVGSDFDWATVTTPDGVATAVYFDALLRLDQAWTSAEFNVFGDLNKSQAIFGSGKTIDVALSLVTGTTASPTCAIANIWGTGTGETNSLNLVPSSCCSSGACPKSCLPRATSIHCPNRSPAY